MGKYVPPKLNPVSMELDEKRAAGGAESAAELNTQERRRLKDLKSKCVGPGRCVSCGRRWAVLLPGCLGACLPVSMLACMV